MPISNNNLKKRANLQKELRNTLKKRQSKINNSNKATTYTYDKATGKMIKGINTGPNEKGSNEKPTLNAFTMAQKSQRNLELSALRGNGTRKKINRGPEPVTREEIKPTFVPSNTGKKVVWKGKVKEKGDDLLFFPSGCVEKETPGMTKIIFTHKGKEYPHWCTRKRK